MRDSLPIQIVAGVTILGSALVIACTLSQGFGPKLDKLPQEATGAAVARLALPLMKPGGHLMVIARDGHSFYNPATDVQLESFKQEARKAGVNISSLQLTQVNPLLPPEVSALDFVEYLRRMPAGSVIVSFLGPPVLNATQRKQTGGKKSSIVAFCPGNWTERANLHNLFDQGLLDIAVVSRPNRPAAATVATQTPTAWFEQNYTIVTAANADDFDTGSKRANTK